MEGLLNNNHMPPPGAKKKLEDYKMLEQLGEGTFGKVFLVEEIKTR